MISQGRAVADSAAATALLAGRPGQDGADVKQRAAEYALLINQLLSSRRWSE
jgi:hypothetical protein